VGGHECPITELPIKGVYAKAKDDPEKAEYLVRVKWLKTVPIANAVKERGFFGNHNTVARPVATSWAFTVQRLKQRFGVE
jgi:predicted Zn-dependent protease